MTRNPWHIIIGFVALAGVVVMASHALSSTRRELGMAPVTTMSGNLVEHHQVQTLPQQVYHAVTKPFTVAAAPTPYAQPTPCEICRLRQDRWMRRLASDGHFYPMQGQTMEIPRASAR